MVKDVNKKVVYLLTTWAFNQKEIHYVTFDLSVVEEWDSRSHDYGYYDYEEVLVYDSKP